MLPLEKGAGLVIRRAKVPVVPAVIVGSYKAWPKHSKMFRPASIVVMYGPPMELAKLGRDEIIQKLETTLHQMLADVEAGKFVKDPPRSLRPGPKSCHPERSEGSGASREKPDPSLRSG